MRKSIVAALGVPLAAAFCWQSACADDGGISFGGSPHLMSGHATVAMKDEVVNMDIGDKVIKVDCKFHFHNDGPPAVVRMGFPDEGQGAAEPYEGVDIRPTGSKLKATFLTYASWVDGKKVPTKLVPTDNRELYWHTKTVNFKPKSDCFIRDTYTLPPGAQVTSENGMYQQTYYVLHTGSSWKGPIGKAKIIVKFAPDVVHGPINLRALSSIPGGDIRHLKWSTLPANTVIYEGPIEPKLEGNTLHFVCENLKPTEKDDVHLYYAFRMLHNM